MRRFVPDFRMIMNKREYIQANKDWLEGNQSLQISPVNRLISKLFYFVRYKQGINKRHYPLLSFIMKARFAAVFPPSLNV